MPHFSRRAWNPECISAAQERAHGLATASSGETRGYRSQAGERTILWNDADLAIPWPVGPQDAIVSEKDLGGRALVDAEVFA